MLGGGAGRRMSRSGVESLFSNLQYTDVPVNGKQSLWSRLVSRLPSWKPTSETLLEQAEGDVLQSVRSPHTDLYVPIARDAVVRTFLAEPTNPIPGSYPLVMIHGFGAGFLQFYKNLDHLHSSRQLLALDVPGFGRSTRVSFSSDPAVVEQEMVDHIEIWRKVLGLEKFILLGHSLGAFLACAYSLSHPERVRHLILVDPWGISPPLPEEEMMKKFPFLAKRFWQMAGHLKPFDPVRVAGPWGNGVIQRTRPDLSRTFGDNFMNYIYHCNVQRPTGEEAFYNMQYMYGWAKRPMLPRLGNSLEQQIPITLILGQRSWMKSVCSEKCIGEEISKLRPQSYVAVHNVTGAGHHVHADRPEVFNELVNSVCSLVDDGEDRDFVHISSSSGGDKEDHIQQTS